MIPVALFCLFLLRGTFGLPAAPAMDGWRVVSWNVESGDADPKVLSGFIAQYEGCDLWGFSEVQNASWAQQFETAAEVGEHADFKRILGSTGRADRLLIVYNASEFELCAQRELHTINPGKRVRSPLVAHLREKDTGCEFLFMVNHLYRSNAAARLEQARQLNAWAQQQRLPIIAVGDYNFDWQVRGGETKHDRAFDALTQDNVFRWVRPKRLVRTQANPRYNSVLDFVFTVDPTQRWVAESEIVVRKNDFPDTKTTSDHRPVAATIAINRGGNAALNTVSEKLLQLTRDGYEKLHTAWETFEK